MGAVDSPTDLDLTDGTAARRLDQRLERLAAGHPSSPDYPDRRSLVREAADVGDGRRRRRGQVRPLTDAEHAEHVAEVEVRLEDARAAGLQTDIQYTLYGGREVWTDERQALHDAIVDDLYARSAGVPCERKAILAGGCRELARRRFSMSSLAWTCRST